MAPQLITVEPRQEPSTEGVAGALPDALVHQLAKAFAAMRRTEDPDHVLDILVSTALLIVPVTSVWAAWKSPGAPLNHATFFDPTVPAGAAEAVPTRALEGAIEAWSEQLAAGRPPFEISAGHASFAAGLAGTRSLTVVPMSSSTRLGALVLGESLEQLGARLPALALLCDRALAELELGAARAAGDRASALSETLTQLAASYSNAELVLQTIVRSAAQLLHADAAYAMLVDETGETLRVRTAYGITGGAFFESSYPVDQLLPGVAIRKRRVICVRDLQAHQEAPKSRSEGLRSAMCAPMFVEDRLVGVLLAAHRSVREIALEDRRAMAALADAAAVSIEGARMFAEREHSIETLAEVNHALEDRSAAAARTIAFQQRLTALILEAGGLDSIVTEMSTALGCQVVIFDRELAVLHASGADGIEPARLHDTLVSLDEAAGIARLEVDGEHVLVAPLDIAGARSAYVVVVGAEANVGMTEAAVTAIGLELMRDRAAAEAEARLTGGLFGALLADEDVDEARILRRASYLGYELGGQNAVIAVHATPENGSSTRRLSLETCVQRAVRRRREGPAAVFEREDAIFVVLSDPDQVSAQLIKEYAAAIKQELDVSGRSVGVRIAYAGPHLGIAGVRRAVQEAQYALHVLGVLGRTGKPQAFGELGVWTLLGRVGDGEHLMSFAGSVLGVLMAHDAERQSQLVDTVRTLVECNFHYRTAAEQLYTHPNTLRYRMSRINELTGLDFADADDRLKVEIALRILDVLGPARA